MTETILIGSRGLNINADAAELKQDEYGAAFLTSCNNVFIGDTGRINRCFGYTSLFSGEVHSVMRVGQEIIFAGGENVYCLDGSSYQLVTDGMSGLPLRHTILHNGAKPFAVFSDGLRIYTYVDGVVSELTKGTYVGVNAELEAALSAPPAGTLLCYGLGRLFVAFANNVFMSQPNQIKLFDLGKGRLTTENEVTLIAPVNKGLWLGTRDQIFYVTTDGINFHRDVKAPYGAFKGTPVPVDAAQLPLQGIYGSGYIVPTARGFAFIGQEGIFVNLTEKVLELRYSTLSDIWMSPYTASMERNRIFFCGAGYSLIMNIHNLAVTQAELYDMEGACTRDSLLYFGNSSGLFRTASSDVEAEFTFQHNFETPVRLRSIELVGEFEGYMYLDATGDENITRTYQLEPIANMKQVSYTKVLRRDNGKARHWKLRIYNGKAGKDFSIDTVRVETTKVSTKEGGYAVK